MNARAPKGLCKTLLVCAVAALGCAPSMEGQKPMKGVAWLMLPAPEQAWMQAMFPMTPASEGQGSTEEPALGDPLTWWERFHRLYAVAKAKSWEVGELDAVRERLLAGDTSRAFGGAVAREVDDVLRGVAQMPSSWSGVVRGFAFRLVEAAVSGPEVSLLLVSSPDTGQPASLNIAERAVDHWFYEWLRCVAYPAADKLPRSYRIGLKVPAASTASRFSVAAELTFVPVTSSEDAAPSAAVQVQWRLSARSYTPPEGLQLDDGHNQRGFRFGAANAPARHRYHAADVIGAAATTPRPACLWPGYASAQWAPGYASTQ